MNFDTYLNDFNGNLVASYGPRIINKDTVEEVSNVNDAEFYGVYRHDSEGFAVWAADAGNMMDARQLAEHIAGIRSRADDLTVAYISMGANEALQELPDDHRPDGGELEFIDSVIRHALMLDRKADNKEFTGVFLYEVAEEFGKKFATHLLMNPAPEIPYRTYAETLADDLIEDATA